MRKRNYFWVLAAILVVAPLVAAYVREARLVSLCKEIGGSFNYSAMACDTETQHPYVPFGSRHLGLAGITLIVLLSLMIAKYVKWRRRLGE
jgi:hypothetical protein